MTLLGFRKLTESCTERMTVQLLQCTGMSRDTFTRPSPVLVLQATNGGVRRPGCEARMQQEHPYMEHDSVDWQPCMKHVQTGISPA